jgi:hypothetical protein
MSFRGACVSQWGEQRRQPVRLAYLTYFYCTNRESVVTPLYQPPWFKSDRQRREDLAVCNTRESMVKPESGGSAFLKSQLWTTNYVVHFTLTRVLVTPRNRRKNQAFRSQQPLPCLPTSLPKIAKESRRKQTVHNTKEGAYDNQKYASTVVNNRAFFFRSLYSATVFQRFPLLQ